MYYPLSRDRSNAFSIDQSELLIASAECSDELRHRVVALQSTEAFDRFEDTGGNPAYYHLPTAPPLHVPLHMPSAADETLGRVGGRQ